MGVLHTILVQCYTCTRTCRSNKINLPLKTSGLTYAKLPRWSVSMSSSLTKCLLSPKLVIVISCVLKSQLQAMKIKEILIHVHVYIK